MNKKPELPDVIYGREYTLNEIAEHFGIGREQVRQIESKALRKLRHESRSHKLRNFEDDLVPEQLTSGGRILPKPSLQQIEEYVPNFWPKII